MYLDKEIISSRNNSFVKWASSLADKKNRKNERYFIAEGVKLTQEALAAGLPVDFCIVNEKKKDAVLESISEFLEDEKFAACKIVTVTDNVFEKISTEIASRRDKRNKIS